MSPIIPSRYGHPKYNSFPQKSRATSFGGIKGISQRGTPGSDSKSRRKQRQEENKITVQPQEDEEADNFYSKHLAAARFQKNHRLINVLFSEVVVDQEHTAEQEKILASNRAKRIKNLEEYNDKISKEIVELEEKFNAKKLKINEDSKKFSAHLNQMVENSKKELTSLRAAQEIRRQKEAAMRALQPPTPVAPSTATTTTETPNTGTSSKLIATSATTNNASEIPRTSSIPPQPSTITTTAPSTIQTNGVPMEIEPKATFIDRDEIQKILDEIIESVTKAV